MRYKRGCMQKWHVKCAMILGLLLSVSACKPVDDAIEQLTQLQKVYIEKIVRDYLLNNPQILADTSKLLQQQHLAEAQKKALAAIPSQAELLFKSTTSPVLGNPKGDMVLVEFTDYQCPHCKTMYPI